MFWLIKYLSSVDVVCVMFSGIEWQFVSGLALSLIFGYAIGFERELRGKDAGISTHTFVIAGSMLFSFLSGVVDSDSKSRIAAQIVTGMGFLGAGLIFRDKNHVKNLTTAASLWFSGAIGMALGFQYYVIAIVAALACVFIPRIPRIR